jgi:hypothetical protein
MRVSGHSCELDWHTILESVGSCLLRPEVFSDISTQSEYSTMQKNEE